MKLMLTLLGVVLLVVAAVYFLMPADQLPGFFPGHEAGVSMMHTKHGIVAGVVGVVLLAAGSSGWDDGERGRRPSAAPRGGMARMSRRVMNLAHFVTQNARRHGDRTGFIWGDRSWTWREIDGHVSALAAALAARGIVKGDRILVHSKNCDEMFWSMFAAFRLGAVWVPTNFRLMPDEVAYLAHRLRREGVSVSRRFSRPCRGGEGGEPGARIHLADRRGRASARHRVGEAIAAHAGAASRMPRSSMTIPAGSSSPRAPQAAPRRRC